MKTLVIAAIGMVMAITTSAARIRYTIDDDWTFDGRRVNLPHTWNAVDAFDKRTPYRRGVGQYRKTLTLDPALRGKRLFLYFEGANQVADVFVNGRRAGQHIGGYTAFAFEITELVTFDAPNTIAVGVDNSANRDIPPLSADFVFFGGIYRDVWLIATSPVHIDVLDHASPGVFIRTEGDVVRIRGRVVNQSGRDADVRVVSSILDANGTIVGTAASKSLEFEQTVRVAHPHLWSPDTPYVYTVRTDVFDGDQLVDSVDNPLGFRTFTVDPQKGFTLNGQPLRLYGTNRHQDYAGLGNAVPNDLARRDIRLVKETGFNFLRLAHYPQDPAVLDATDRAGLVVWEEIPIVNAITNSDAFAANAEQMLVEMIRQHYNHPSVFFWGFMNEVTLRRKDDPLPEHDYEKVVALARRLNARTHLEDATRKTVMALSHQEIDGSRELSDVTDILGMNLYFGWYYGKFSDLGDFIDRIHRERPDRPLTISEYGAGDDERIHAREPKRFDFSAEYAQQFHRASFPQLEQRPFLIATAVWNQFDFAAPRDDTKFGINNKGLFLYDRAPKDTSLYYRAALLRTPVLAIGRESTKPVTVYTNEPQCELFVNGRSLGTRNVGNRTASWDVELTPGENRVTARAGSLEDAMTIVDERSLAINAGSDDEFIDASHVVWNADRGFTGGAPIHTNHRIYDTNDDPLYQSAREGMSQYRLDVPDGTYSVTMHFAEIDPNVKPGERVFSVRINGIDVIHDLQLEAFTALSRTFTVEARNGSGIVVEFAARSGKPLLSAVMIRACIGC